ncbi:class I poly(R)-hydroxyalkanoic acid synthase [Terasakiella brassicae]|uniref:Class I poly(R)-hydroxyalkanoic acid synthase n=1 Tax=Terasakiella brassicae TaxID=1634917 RepID=A0A917C1M8_9PROT|nr:class I poly(R)-hydroxyalkanoic acid synthase [Terasakiella brassicae]GGF67466.1 class I poly(R)-hydroxyalkanoic acid synthase [Terasakiella brassicae]
MTQGQEQNLMNVDQQQLMDSMQDFAERSQRIMTKFLERQAEDDGFQIPDPYVVGKAFLKASTQLMQDPQRLAQAQADLWKEYTALWQHVTQRMLGQETEPVAKPVPGDRRFKDEAWEEEIYFDAVKQYYLLTARWIKNTMSDVNGIDESTQKKVDFYTRNFVQSMAPSNFAATNPAVIKAAVETQGQSLLKGFDHFLKDLEEGKGKLRVSMTDVKAFELGKNVASTPGKVVYQNGLIQLLQYEPTTEKVAKNPLLIVPPWINKFYVLDLQPKNSLIKWAVDQGHTVFVISWINPDEKLAHKDFSCYMQEGPLNAIDVVQEITGADQVNIAGYCIGGTLTSCTLAYLAAIGEADKVKSATLFTTLTDFTDCGELRVFIDEEQMEILDAHMERKGYLEGAQMSQVFNLLRANDLVWSFFVNNYLLGKEPFPFDLLYWNSDPTRMPAMMHKFYLRKMYLENKLIEPNGIELNGVPIDLRKIETPMYMISTHDDHIAPWKSTYSLTQHVSGPVKFVLGGSGHIAGIINPENSGKYGYWTNTNKPADPDKWLAGAKQNEGSWWQDWKKWIARHSGGKVDARAVGSKKHKPIEDAPGSYVKVRMTD